MRDLSKMEREVIEMHERGRMSVSQIAAKLGKSTQNVYSSLTRAREKRASVDTNPEPVIDRGRCASLDEIETCEPCDRCGLHGPHECVPPIEFFAGMRYG